MKLNAIQAILSGILVKGGLKFACIQLTTQCNAMCLDRCNIWSLRPEEMACNDAKFVIDVLAYNGFTFAYFTGGEPGMYPYLTEVVSYAKKRGLVTSITTNGTIDGKVLRDLKDSLDVPSVSVDHYNPHVWEEAKHLSGVDRKAKSTIELAKALGIKVYGITFLNPAWTEQDVEKIIKYVNDDLGVSFTLSYPYSTSNYGSFIVGLSLPPRIIDSKMERLVEKVFKMKASGFRIANASCYLKDVNRALNGLPTQYPCQAGKNIVAIDCNLNVSPCYKKMTLF